MKILTHVPARVTREGEDATHYRFTVELTESGRRFNVGLLYEETVEQIVQLGEVNTNDCIVVVSEDGAPAALFLTRRDGTTGQTACQSVVEIVQ